MRAAGIIAEYNPMHSGHLRQIAALRERIGDCAVVVCMSGSFVQRGEPAIFSKTARAEAAVRAEGGADLVLELQTPFAMSRAQRFASEGVRLLGSAGVIDTLCFGAECGDVDALSELSAILETPEFSELLAKELQNGSDFASARQRTAAAMIGPERASLLEGPNNILGIEYLSALRWQGWQMRPLAVGRTGAAHDAPAGDGNEQSASALRTLIREDRLEQASRSIPAGAWEIYCREMEEGRGPMTLSRIETALLGQLRRMKPEDFAILPDLSEGLEYRLYAAAEERSIDAICAAAKTKRYSLARIRRLVLSACLGISEEVASAGACYLRVLAVNERGREVLREMRERALLPVVVKPSDALALGEKERRLAETESLVCDLYGLGYDKPTLRGSDFRSTPAVISG